MANIFISYARADALEIAKELHYKLLIYNHQVFWDKTNLHVGVDWEKTLYQEIARTDCIVVLVTVKSNESKYVLDEVNEGIKLNKVIIPVQIGETPLPPHLAKWQAIKFQDNNYDTILLEIERILPLIFRKKLKNFLKAISIISLIFLLLILVVKLRTLNAPQLNNKGDSETQDRTENTPGEVNDEQNLVAQFPSLEPISLTNATLLTELDTWGNAQMRGSPAWSMDAKKIAVPSVSGILLFNLDEEAANPTTLSSDDASSGTYVVFSPNNQWIASGHQNGYVYLWDINTLEVLAAFPGFHSNSTIAFSPSSKLIAYQSNNQLLLWEVETRRKITTFETYVDTLTYSDQSTNDISLVVKISIDTSEKYIAAVISGQRFWWVDEPRNSLVKIWNIETGSVEQEIYGNNGPITPDFLSFNENRNLIFGERGNDYNTVIKNLDYLDNQLETIGMVQNAGRFDISINSLIMLYLSDNKITAFDLQKNEDVGFIEGFSPDENIFLAINPINNHEVAVVRYGLGELDIINVVENSQEILYQNEYLDIRRLEQVGDLLGISDFTRTTLMSIQGVKSNVSIQHSFPFPSDDGLTISSNEQLLAAAGGGYVRIWNIQSGEIIDTYETEFLTSALAFTPNSRKLAIAQSPSSSSNGKINIYDLSSHNTMVFDVAPTLIYDLEFISNTELIAASSSNELVVLNIETGSTLYIPGHNSWVTDIDFNTRVNLIASASNDGTVKLWDLRSKILVRTLTLSNTVYSVAFDGTGNLLASANSSFFPEQADTQINVWDVKTGYNLANIKPNIPSIYSLKFSHGNTLLVMGGEDGILRFWGVTERN